MDDNINHVLYTECCSSHIEDTGGLMLADRTDSSTRSLSDANRSGDGGVCTDDSEENAGVGRGQDTGEASARIRAQNMNENDGLRLRRNSQTDSSDNTETVLPQSINQTSRYSDGMNDCLQNIDINRVDSDKERENQIENLKNSSPNNGIPICVIVDENNLSIDTPYENPKGASDVSSDDHCLCNDGHQKRDPAFTAPEIISADDQNNNINVEAGRFYDIDINENDETDARESLSWGIPDSRASFSNHKTSPLPLHRNANYFFHDQSGGRERIFASVSTLLSIVFYTFLFGIFACIASSSCTNSRMFFAIPIAVIYVVYLAEALMDRTTRNYLKNPMTFKQFGDLVHQWRTTAPMAMVTVRLLPGWDVRGRAAEQMKKDRKLSATLVYKKCVDQSDDIVKMATHKRYKVVVHKTFICADTVTSKNLEREVEAFKKYCGFTEKGMQCVRELELEGWQKRLLVYSDGKPWYLNMTLYWISLVLALNGPHRVWIYFRFSETFNYNIIKSFSVRRE